MTLPYAAQGQDYSIAWQESFGGLDERLGAPEGAMVSMENMTGDHWPVLSSRPPRRKFTTLTAPHGFGGADKLYWVDGTQFYYDGAARGSVAEGDKRFCCLGSYIVIWPDKCYYNTKTGEFGALEANVSCAAAEIYSAKSPSGASSECNCLHLPNSDAQTLFAPNEAVTITGCDDASNDRTLVIREVSGDQLFFYDESFTMQARAYCVLNDPLRAGNYCFYHPGNDIYYSFELTETLDVGMRLSLETDSVQMQVTNYAGTTVKTITVDMGRWADAEEISLVDYSQPQLQSGTVTVKRTVPELEYVCQCSNRLWGVHGNTICCSYLGNPKVWNNFDSTATACWSVEVGSADRFTAACAYGGYPLFFKENHIYRVYGTKNANYQLFDTQTLGVEYGSEKSLAVVGQALYYKTRAGFVCYAGGVPRRIDAALGMKRRQEAVAGTDGRKYYVSCCVGDDWELLVYDAQNALWHREDGSRAVDMVWCGGELYMLRSDGTVWMIGRVRSSSGESEGTIESGCTLASMTGSGGRRDAVVRLYFCLSADEALTAEVEYDGSGVWEKMTSIADAGRAVRTVELVPRRCGQFRIRLRGRGDWKLWALGREYAAGSRREG